MGASLVYSRNSTYNYYQATTTSGLLSFIVHPRVSILATKTLLLVGHYLDAEEYPSQSVWIQSGAALSGLVTFNTP